METKDGYKHYSAPYKEFMAKQVLLDGKKMTTLAEENSIPYGTLKRWVAEQRDIATQREKDRKKSLLTATEYKELYESEKRLREEAEEEVEI